MQIQMKVAVQFNNFLNRFPFIFLTENWMLLYMTTSGVGKKSNFCECCKISLKYENTIVGKYLHQEKYKLRSRLDEIQKERISTLYDLLRKFKFLSKLSCHKDYDEISPLVSFGSVFSRTLKEKLFIGVPVLNNSLG